MENQILIDPKNSREIGRGAATLVNNIKEAAKDKKLGVNDLLSIVPRLGVYQDAVEDAGQFDDECVALDLLGLSSVAKEFDAIELEDEVDEKLLENFAVGMYSITALAIRLKAKADAEKATEADAVE